MRGTSKDGGITIPRRIVRYCARCGRGVTLVCLRGVDGRERLYTDGTTCYYAGRLFLCSRNCWAAVLAVFGSVDAFEEWALSPSSVTPDPAGPLVHAAVPGGASRAGVAEGGD